MEWPEPGVYQGVCKYCGAVRHEDANLGLGRDDARTRVCGRYAARQEMVETNGDTPEEETMGEIQIPEFPPGQKANTAKGKFYAAHINEIRQDIATIGREGTVEKWGMSMDWTYRAVPAGKNRKPRAKMRQPAALPAPAVPPALTEAVGANCHAPEAGHNGHSPLPPWRDDWKPDVQIEWLRASRDIEVARIAVAK
jgi:hypothetical protein